MHAATGQQIVLRAEGAEAIIGTVAAVLRSLTVAGGIAIVESFPEASPPPWGSGIALAPWPNRVRDGRWTVDGVAQQLDITEVERGNAIHGLVRYADYAVRERSDSAVTLETLIPPQHGWPFLLGTWVRYELRAEGITVTHGGENRSSRRAPWAVGAHPYLRVGDAPVEELVLSVFAATSFELDERGNPVAEVPVADTDLDLGAGRRIADLDLDTTFGGVTPRAGASASVKASDGGTVELLQDVDWGYVQVFTNRSFPRESGTGTAIAVEPMTAPPDALNSGQGLRWLDPGESWEGSWGLRYSGPGTPA